MKTSTYLPLMRKYAFACLILLFCLLIKTQSGFGQSASQYIFSTNGTSSLASDLSGNAIDMSTGTAALIGASVDDGASAVTNIGFSFAFMSTGGTNNVFTQFSASTNGAIRLGATQIADDIYGNNFPIANQAIISPYWGDLGTHSNGKIHYKLVGTYPNRTLVIEFLNMKINYNSSSNNGTYQVRLYEQTNVIEFVYGAMAVGSSLPNNTDSRTAIIGFSRNTGNNNQFSVSQVSPYTTSTSATRITNTNSTNGTIAGLNSSANGSRRAFIFTPTLAYKSQFISMNTGSANWCAGETRNVSVTLKNIGTAAWTTSGPAFNVGIKWNTNGTSWNDYNVRVSAAGLTPGQTGTYNFSITASNNVSGSYTTPLSAGTNNLTFDIVEEGVSWFGDNGGNTGPGNIVFKSPNQTIVAAPNVSNFSTDVSAACLGSGGTVNLTSTSLGNGTPFTVTYNLTGANTVTGSTASVTFASNSGSFTIPASSLPNAGATTLTITSIQNSNGCSSNLSSGNTANFTVSAPPDVSNFTTSASLVCAGSANAININSSSLVDGAYTVTYNLSGANTGSALTASLNISGGNGTFNTPVLNNGGSTTVTITSIKINGVNCNSTPSSPGNAAAFFVDKVTGAISGNATVCSGNNTNLSIAVTGAGPWSGTLSTGQSFSGSSNPILVSVSPASTTTYTISTLSDGSCTAAASGKTGSATITVKQPPVVTSQPTSTSTCANTSGSFSVTASGTSPNFIWQYFNGSSWLTVNNGNPAGYTYTVTGTSPNSTLTVTPPTNAANTTLSYRCFITVSGCEAANAISDAVTLTVYAQATVSAGADQTVCNTSSSVTLAGIKGGSASVATWSGGGGTFSPNNTTLNAVYAPSAAELSNGSVVTLTLTTDDPAGPCGAVSDQMKITINKASTVEAAGPDVRCQSASPDPLTLSGAVFGGGATAAAWTASIGILSSSGTNSGSSTSTPATEQYQAPSNYSGPVTLTLTTNALPACVPVSDTRIITINPAATVTAGAELNICQLSTPSPVTLSGASFGGSATSATWSIISGGGTLSNTGPTADPANVTYTPATGFSGSVVLSLTATDPDGAGPCSSVSATRTIIITPAPVITSVTATPATICKGSSSNLVVSATALGPVPLINENFNGTSSFTSAGTITGFNFGEAFTVETSPYSAPYFGTFRSPDNSKFMFAEQLSLFIGNTSSTLTSASVSTVNFSSATLSFQHALSVDIIANATGKVEASTNNGSTWTTIATYSPTQGSQTAFASVSLSLPAGLLNQANLKIRFNFSSTSVIAGAGYWAIDNVTLTGTPNAYTYAWTAIPSGATAGLPASAATASAANANITVNPTVTTQYTVTQNNYKGCTSSGQVTVTVNQPSIAPTGATATPAAICSGSSTTIKQTGGALGTGAIWHWYLDAALTIPAGTSLAADASLTVAPSVTTTYYIRAEGAAAPCGTNTTSSSVTVTVSINSWIGVTSTNWSEPTNWCSGIVPTASTSANIPSGTPYSPQLTGDAAILNLSIQNGAVLDLSGYTLTANGAFSGTGKLTGSAESGLIATGNTDHGTVYFTQNIPYNQLKTLTVNSGSLTLGGSSTGGDTLNIIGGNSSTGYGTVTSNGTLNTNDILTLRSNQSGTARVAQSSGSIAGNVLVERYIGGHRAWRYLTAPVSGPQTINQAWQEGVKNPDLGTNINPKPGYGTHISGGSSTNGFDVNTTGNPSILTLDEPSQDWMYVAPPTISTRLDANYGYYTFVRGSRAVNLSQGQYAVADSTKLRAKGTLQLGTIAKPLTGASGHLVVGGNPYASSIKILDVLSSSSGITPDKFYIYDPLLAGNYGVGAVVTYSAGTFVPRVPGGGTGTASYPDDNSVTITQSGQAFLVELQNASGSLNFKEADKITTEYNVFGLRVAEPKPRKPDPKVYINLNLPQAGDSLLLLDGVAAVFDNRYSDSVDYNDAIKNINVYEDMSLVRYGKALAIETRPVPEKTDTLYLTIGNVLSQPYVLQVLPESVPPAVKQAWLIDKYLNTQTALSTTQETRYTFSTTGDAASYINRFMIVFTIEPKKKGENAAPIAKSVNMQKQEGEVSVSPNPVTGRQNAQLKFSNMAKGDYEIEMYNSAGRKMLVRTLSHPGGNGAYPFTINTAWAADKYNIAVVNKQTKTTHNLTLLISR